MVDPVKTRQSSQNPWPGSATGSGLKTLEKTISKYCKYIYIFLKINYQIEKKMKKNKRLLIPKNQIDER